MYTPQVLSRLERGGPAAVRGAGRHPARRGELARQSRRFGRMERREAQHPGGRPRKPAVVAVRAPGSGPRKPALEPRRADRPIARAVQRGLANPWRLPALHSLFGGEEKGTPARPRRPNNRADDARPGAGYLCRGTTPRLKTNHASCTMINQAPVPKNAASARASQKSRCRSSP